jgi:SulP family sulfate permease
MGGVPVIDATGERALHTIADACRRTRVRLMITGLQSQPAEVLAATGMLQSLGSQNIFRRTGPAIDEAIANMDPAICASCPHAPFRECPELKTVSAVLSS